MSVLAPYVLRGERRVILWIIVIRDVWIYAFAEVTDVFVVKGGGVVFGVSEYHYVATVAFGYDVGSGFGAVCKNHKAGLRKNLVCVSYNVPTVWYVNIVCHVFHQRVLGMQYGVAKHSTEFGWNGVLLDSVAVV